MKRHVIEGVWRGYRSSMDRPVHREVSTAPKFVEWCQRTFCIRYTDGTTLELHVRECKPRERVKEINGYRSLIRDCFYHNVSSVHALCEIEAARKAEQEARKAEAHQ